MDPTAIGGDPAAIWKFVSFTLGAVVVVLSGALVAMWKLLLKEKEARLEDKEAVIRKLEEAREAKNRRERETDRRDS